ncbi:MAG: ROK family protein, partial [Bryobacteraceae bacterium]
MNCVLAVDVGGTKLAVAVVDPEGRIHARRKAPVEKRDPAATAEQIAALGEAALSEARVAAQDLA